LGSVSSLVSEKRIFEISARIDFVWGYENNKNIK
jgi:hypothetical protein